MTLPILSIDRSRAYPPRVTAFTRRFWDALAEGRLETTRCNGCDRLSFPPKPICPHCWSSDIGWTALSGRGRLYSRTVVHAAPAVFQPEAPYGVGVIDLDEGLRIATRVIGDPPPELDATVELVVLSYSDGPLYAARAMDGP
ncbi:Zn-ribbon domain-containing OB-fold protein [Brevundimonas diminuta]|uniref:Zn-ribbon domain-containing OB-fold protein n=1 Tax=Brevundimonas diminuta TaxID=293 RepID=UPI003D9A17C6